MAYVAPSPPPNGRNLVFFAHATVLFSSALRPAQVKTAGNETKSSPAIARSGMIGSCLLILRLGYRPTEIFSYPPFVR